MEVNFRSDVHLMLGPEQVRHAMYMHMHTDIQTDRQTDRRMDGWMGRQTDGQTGRQTDRQTDRYSGFSLPFGRKSVLYKGTAYRLCLLAGLFSSVGRASVYEAESCGFESHRSPLFLPLSLHHSDDTAVSFSSLIH